MGFFLDKSVGSSSLRHVVVVVMRVRRSFRGDCLPPFLTCQQPRMHLALSSSSLTNDRTLLNPKDDTFLGGFVVDSVCRLVIKIRIWCC